MTTANHQLSAIVDSMNRGQCVLCVSSRLDTGRDFRGLVEVLLGELPDVDWPTARRVLASNPLTAAGYARRHLGDGFLPALARATRSKSVPGSVQLLAEMPFHSIITTSLGHAFERSTFEGSVYTAHDTSLLYLDNRERHLLKMLGDARDPGTIIWTARDVTTMLADIERRATLQQVYGGCNFLLVGFSAGDADLELLLEHILTPVSEVHTEHYAMMLDISDMEREELAMGYHITVLAQDDELQFICALRDALNDADALADADDTDDDDTDTAGAAAVTNRAGAAAAGNAANNIAGAGANRAAVGNNSSTAAAGNNSAAADGDNNTVDGHRDGHRATQRLGVVIPALSVADRIEGCLTRLEADPDDQEALIELDALDQLLRRSRDHERLVDLYVGRIDIAAVPGQRAELLRELSSLFEYEMDDLERALRARLASYEHAPRLAMLPELERLAAATGAWHELLDVVENSLVGPSVADVADGPGVADVAGVPGVPDVFDVFAPADRVQALLVVAGICQQHTDDSQRALDCVALALEIDPEHAAARSLQLQLLRGYERWQELADVLEAALETTTAPVARAEKLAELAALHESRIDDPDRALDYYRRALDSDPWAHDARLAYESLLRRRRSHGELMHSLEHRLEQATMQEQVAIRRELAGLCDQELGARVLAIRYYEDLRMDAPADMAVLSALARLYEQQGCIRESLEVLSTQLGIVDDNQARTDICLDMADKWRQLGSQSDVRECLEWALAYGDGREDLFAPLEQMYCQLGDWRAAIDLYTRHAKAAPDDEQRARLYCEIAGIHERELDDLGCAIDSYLQVLDAVPGHGRALDELTRLYEAREAFDELIDMLAQRARGEDVAERVDLLHRAGRIALTRMDDSKAAGELFERALEANPNHVPTLRALAAVQREHGDHARAVALLRRALDATNGNAADNAADDNAAAAAATDNGDNAAAADNDNAADDRGAATTEGRAAAAPDANTDDRDDNNRVALLMAMAAIHEEREDHERAATTYRELLDADPGHVQAANRLCDLLWRRQDHRGAMPLLRLLMEREPHVRHALRLGIAASRSGDADLADREFAAALALAPDDRDALDAYSRFLCEREDWQRGYHHARELARLHDASSTSAQFTRLHHRLALCALKLGERTEARQQVLATLAVNPTHRPTLTLSLELERDNPKALLAILDLMLEIARDDDERARLLGESADVHFAHHGDPERALTVLRQALAYRPHDRLLLHKYLDVLLAGEAWEDGVSTLDRLIETEKTAAVRAKYRYTAAMLLLDKLEDRARAHARLEIALQEDPTLDRAFSALEEMLREDKAWLPLKERYCAEIQRLGPGATPRDQAQLLRLWAALGQLCVSELDELEEGILAYEVAAQLGAAQSGRVAQLGRDDIGVYQALAPLYAQMDSEPYLDKAIAAYHVLVRADRRCRSHYQALSELYTRAGADDRAQLCINALKLLEMHQGGRMPRLHTERILDFGSPVIDSRIWNRIRHPDLDRRLSTVFAIVAPALVLMRARPAKQLGLDEEQRVGPGDDRRFAEILRYVAKTLAVPLPAAYASASQERAVRVVACTTAHGSGLALTLGERVTANISEREVLFHVARYLATLQPELMISNLVTSAADLAHVLDAVLFVGADAGTAAATPAIANTAAAMTSHLPTAALQRALEVATQLRVDDDLDTRRAAAEWLQAARATAVRVGLAMTGDTGLCMRLLGNELSVENIGHAGGQPSPGSAGPGSAGPGSAGARSDAAQALVVDLIWTSITDEFVAVTRYLSTPAGRGNG